jgi:hypothetical protein
MCIAVLILFVPSALFGQSFSIYPNPNSGAGGTVKNSLFTIRGSIGQYEVTTQTIAGESFSLTGGFWTFPDILTPPPEEYLQLTMPSTNIQFGQSASVPINLSSSESVTYLALTLRWPSNYFAEPQITVADPLFASASLQDDGTNLAIIIQALPGQALQNQQTIAQLSFSEASQQLHSAIVPLPIASVAALKADGSSYTNYLIQSATIAVIEDRPLLLAIHSSGQNNLELYGFAGVNYQLQYTTNLALPDSWLPLTNFVQTAGALTVPVDSTNSEIFYRIVQP